MQLNWFFLTTIGVGLAILVSSCSIRPKIFLYNNSGQALTILTEDGSYHVVGGAIVEILYPKSQTMQINVQETQWKYKLAYPPKEYMTVGGHEMHFQIEANGFIYVLLPQQQGPALDLSAQPKGFPLTPVLTTSAVGDVFGCVRPWFPVSEPALS